jgi:Glycine zipper
MKKLFGLIMCLVLLAGTMTPALAQRYGGRYDSTYRRYDNSRRVYYGRRYNDRSFWDKHRDKVTVAAGAGAGAVIGGLAGGRKGAIIGALLGAGGSALYTYKLRDRDGRRYYRRR